MENLSKVCGKWSRGIQIGCEDPPIKTNHPQSFRPVSTLEKNLKVPVSQKKQTIIKVMQDGRPYIDVELYGERRSGLLDSGASITIKRLCPLIEEKRVNIKKEIVNVKVANGGNLEVVGALQIPYTYKGKEFTHKTIIVYRWSTSILSSVFELKIDLSEGSRVLAVEQKEHKEEEEDILDLGTEETWDETNEVDDKEQAPAVSSIVVQIPNTQKRQRCYKCQEYTDHKYSECTVEKRVYPERRRGRRRH